MRTDSQKLMLADNHKIALFSLQAWPAVVKPRIKIDSTCRGSQRAVCQTIYKY